MSDTKGAPHQEGIALLGAMVIALILSMLGATLLNLAGLEIVSAKAGREAVVVQQLADAAAELVVSWFHSPETKSTPSSVASILAKKHRNVDGAPSFFDETGRSQFVGTASRPDFQLNAGKFSDNEVLNDSETGLFRAAHQLGTIEELRIFAPLNPGLLCTVDATVATQANPPVRQSVQMQLGALNVAPLRAAVQVGQDLGAAQTGRESPVSVHWGDLKVQGNLVVGRADEIPTKTLLAPVTGQGYDETVRREDQWTNIWVGGQVQVLQVPASPGVSPSLPANVHAQQNPVPGVRLDQWAYEQLKGIAKRYGSYFAIDRDGLLYPQGTVEPGHGVSPDEVFRSRRPGDQRGLIFIDTLDQAAPRADNLGVIRLRSGYLEGMVVMQGHVVLIQNGPGESISVLSPPMIDRDIHASRKPVQISQVHLYGVLYAAGNITVNGRARLYGAVAAGGTIASATSGGTLEVWYDHDLGQGLYRGLPVVYRAPGTWLARY